MWITASDLTKLRTDLASLEARYQERVAHYEATIRDLTQQMVDLKRAVERERRRSEDAIDRLLVGKAEVPPITREDPDTLVPEDVFDEDPAGVRAMYKRIAEDGMLTVWETEATETVGAET